MVEKESENVYNIPVNYTDSGKLFGGLVSWRNAIETVLLVVVLGFIELKLIPMPDTVKVVIMTITLVPLAIFSAMGVDGDSLLQYSARIIKYMFKRKKVHYKRIDIADEEK